ncbi:MAG: hypothetical protein ACBR23_16235 [Microcoleus sp.]
MQVSDRTISVTNSTLKTLLDRDHNAALNILAKGLILIPVVSE